MELGFRPALNHLTIRSFKLEVLGVCMALKAYILSFVLHSPCDFFSRLPIYRNPKLNLHNMTSLENITLNTIPGPVISCIDYGTGKWSFLPTQTLNWRPMPLLLALGKGKGDTDKSNYSNLKLLLRFLPIKVRTENSSLNYEWWEQGRAHWQSLYPHTRYTFKIRKASNIILVQNKKDRESGERAKQQIWTPMMSC